MAIDVSSFIILFWEIAILWIPLPSAVVVKPQRSLEVIDTKGIYSTTPRLVIDHTSTKNVLMSLCKNLVVAGWEASHPSLL